MDQVQAHFTPFPSVGEESAAKATEGAIERCHERLFERCAEDDAIYFSRRAREERRLSLNGNCRKCRQTHLELAQAYEFRAHLLTQETPGHRVSQLLHAL
jgi:hypothetical protein